MKYTLLASNYKNPPSFVLNSKIDGDSPLHAGLLFGKEMHRENTATAFSLVISDTKHQYEVHLKKRKRKDEWFFYGQVHRRKVKGTFASPAPIPVNASVNGPRNNQTNGPRNNQANANNNGPRNNQTNANNGSRNNQTNNGPRNNQTNAPDNNNGPRNNQANANNGQANAPANNGPRNNQTNNGPRNNQTNANNNGPRNNQANAPANNGQTSANGKQNGSGNVKR